jgi:hypothetical protein
MKVADSYYLWIMLIFRNCNVDYRHLMDMIKTAMECGNGLISLVNNILDMSRLEAMKVLYSQCECWLV